MFTHYQRIWQFNFVVVWPILWLAYVIQNGLNAVSAVGGFLVLLILVATGRRYWSNQAIKAKATV